MNQWKYVKLGEVCTVERGGSPRPIDDFITTDENGINWIKIGDADESMYITKTAQRIKPEGMKKSRYVKPGDFLLSNSMSFGRPYILKIDGCIHDGWLVLRDENNVFDKKFLYYYLSAPITYKKFKSMAVGGVVNNLNSDMVRKVRVPIPSQEEQHRISDRLDKVSNVIFLRNQQLDKLDELVKARFVEMFGDPVSNPLNWPTAELGKRCEIITGNTPSRAEPENYGTFIEWIKSDNINTPSTFLTEAQERLSEIGFQKCRFVESGSLLMTCIAGSLNCIGNVAVVNRRVAFNQQINAITPTHDNVLYLYWLMILSKPTIHRTINMALKGILSKSQLSSIKFPFPPLPLQNQFAAFVERVDQQKQTVQQSLEKLELMKKALMQEYFG